MLYYIIIYYKRDTYTYDVRIDSACREMAFTFVSDISSFGSSFRMRNAFRGDSMYIYTIQCVMIYMPPPSAVTSTAVSRDDDSPLSRRGWLQNADVASEIDG